MPRRLRTKRIFGQKIQVEIRVIFDKPIHSRTQTRFKNEIREFVKNIPLQERPILEDIKFPDIPNQAFISLSRRILVEHLNELKNRLERKFPQVLKKIWIK